jgi:hypothetical protein
MKKGNLNELKKRKIQKVFSGFGIVILCLTGLIASSFFVGFVLWSALKVIYGK